MPDKKEHPLRCPVCFYNYKAILPEAKNTTCPHCHHTAEASHFTAPLPEKIIKPKSKNPFV
jgi:rubredoxin